MASMTLEIISPDKVFFKGEVTLVTVPGAKGPFTILPRHAAIISTLTKGNVVYVAKGEEMKLPINNGFVEVCNNVITICVESVNLDKLKKNNELK